MCGMNKPKIPLVVTLKQLNQKLDQEIKRLIREQEEGVVKLISKKAVMNGDSKLVFKSQNGKKVIMSFRLNKDGNLRFAREEQFTNK